MVAWCCHALCMDYSILSLEQLDATAWRWNGVEGQKAVGVTQNTVQRAVSFKSRLKKPFGGRCCSQGRAVL